MNVFIVAIEDIITADRISMPLFRAKRLDIAGYNGGFVNNKVIRDHTRRKVYERFEEER